MPRFKPGDRVQVKSSTEQCGFVELTGTHPQFGAVVLVSVGGDSRWWKADIFELDPAFVVGSAEWLERRSYDAAFARE